MEMVIRGREIKFRGKSLNEGKRTGRWVYGDLLRPWADDQQYPMIRECIDDHTDEDGVEWASCRTLDVEPDSVSQLIGVDKNGREVYEGEPVKVVGTEDMTFEATMADYFAIKMGKVIKCD